MATRNITHAGRAFILPLLLGVVLIVAGALMCIYKRDALQYILMVSGALLVVSGIIGFISNMSEKQISLASIIIALFGVVLIVIPGLISDILMVILAVMIALYGIFTLFAVLGGERENNLNFILGLVVGALSLALGVYALFNLNGTANVVMVVIGAVLIFLGIVQVFRSATIYRETH